MFWNKNKIDTKMIQAIRPTSKASLKQQCLLISKGDLDQATKLYDFYIKDMEDLPNFDLVQPTTMQQARTMVVDTFKWANDNQEQIMNWVGFIKNLFGKNGGTNITVASQPLPPINK